LAALGGILAAPLVTASHGMAATVIIDAFVIVIIGGMGSFLGSLIGALLIGFVQVFGNYTSGQGQEQYTQGSAYASATPAVATTLYFRAEFAKV
jgi:branched-subunit amino acid ABC-type transport system permease component